MGSNLNWILQSLEEADTCYCSPCMEDSIKRIHMQKIHTFLRRMEVELGYSGMDISITYHDLTIYGCSGMSDSHFFRSSGTVAHSALSLFAMSHTDSLSCENMKTSPLCH